MSDKLLRRRPHGTRAGETAETEAIGRQVRRLGSIVEHIVDALQIRAGGIALALDTCDLTTIAEPGVKSVAERARRAGCVVTVSAESPVVGRWDRARLAQLLGDLLDNAVKFGAGKPIRVDVRRDGTDAVLTVRDRGVRIPPDRLASILSAFERGVPKEHFDGLGLGLYIAKAIAEAHGGSIAVMSDSREGSRVRRTLAARALSE